MIFVKISIKISSGEPQIRQNLHHYHILADCKLAKIWVSITFDILSACQNHSLGNCDEVNTKFISIGGFLTATYSVKNSIIKDHFC